MDARTRYLVYAIIILTICAIIPNSITNSRYFSNINIESDVKVGAMIFEIKQNDTGKEFYSVSKGEEIVANYVLNNYDDNNNVNQMELKYYLKIVDINDSEELPLEFELEGYNYIKEDDNKGFGPIELVYDGQTKEAKDLKLKIKCPESYSQVQNTTYKVKIVAEGIINTEFKAEDFVELNLHINENLTTNNTQNSIKNNENVNNNTESSEELQVKQEENNKDIVETESIINNKDSSVENSDSNIQEDETKENSIEEIVDD